MDADFPDSMEGHEIPEESQDLYEHHHLIADKGQGLLRIDKFLMARIENASRNKIQQAAHAGNILVNDKPVKPNYRVHPGDVISIVLSYPPREIEIIAQDIPVEILYEDKDLLIVNKQPGLVVHPAYGNYTGTLVNALAHHLQFISPDREPGRLPLLVHRIDKDTSGVMAVCKNELAQARLAAQFFHHTIRRHYQALVWGDLKEDAGALVGDITENSPAEKAGLQRGDIILEYDGKKISEPYILRNMVANNLPGEEHTVVVLRDGKTRNVQITIGELPSDAQQPVESAGFQNVMKGITVQDMSPELAKKLRIPDKIKGVVINDIDESSMGVGVLAQGDVIQEINRKKVKDTKAYTDIVSKIKKDESVLLLIYRSGSSLFVTLSAK